MILPSDVKMRVRQDGVGWGGVGSDECKMKSDEYESGTIAP